MAVLTSQVERSDEFARRRERMTAAELHEFDNAIEWARMGTTVALEASPIAAPDNSLSGNPAEQAVS